MPVAVQLRRRREPGGTGTDDADALAERRAGGSGSDPALVERALGDRHLDLLDRDASSLIARTQADHTARDRSCR